ncbi:SDR family oxidoreductase [Catenulispora sp. NF23]|uniref:SDR family oxidoreductase n=1 Tax=Catenulispora pinistramenti TaxID=2705254 RepID=UPI001BACFB77|nr:SDR family oxidoreductase [Catenulispora pinistramenti]MBS2535487.1 SDR family oxidoreductase [Catenulispora pinistramenti]
MAGICEGRVAVVTGAGRGLGRAHALEFARQGAKVVVNDLGVGPDGRDGSDAPAQEVVTEIVKAGGEAVADDHDIASWDGAAALVQTALEAFGKLDVLVNNAGFLRDRMLVNLSEQDWDDVVRVHLKGHFLTLRHAGAHWRDQYKLGNLNDARVINTSSGAGLLGSVGQGNYAAAKAGIAALTIQAAAELGRYGVTVNAIAPAARTRMTEGPFSTMMAAPDDGFDAMAPENVSPLVVWLGSDRSRAVSGRVFEVEGGRIGVADGWQHGPTVDKGARWEPAELDAVVAGLIGQAPVPGPVYGG